MKVPSRHAIAVWCKNLATRDFFPGFSAKMRRVMYNPLGVLVLAALVALLCGFFLHAQGFVLAGGVFAVIFLGVLWPSLSLRGTTGELQFDRPRAEESEPLEVQLSLRNRLPWSVWGLAVRGGFGAADAAQPVAAVTAIAGRRVTECRWQFTPARRGVYPLSSPRLTNGFPFGLWENSRKLEVPRSLVVWPKTFAVGPVPPVSGDRQVEGTVSRSKIGTTGDVVGVRPYRRGDSPRRIHWSQSAKHDRLIVCELQSNSRPVIQLVLDIDPRVHCGTGENSSREWAIRMAASFAKGWLEAGAQVGLACAGIELAPASGLAQTHAILDALAAIPESATQPLADLLACPVCRGFRDGLQIIITTDRSHGGGGCGSCASEDQRWVILTANGFADGIDISAHTCADAVCAEPWLTVENAEQIPELLRGGWREARHGS